MNKQGRVARDLMDGYTAAMAKIGNPSGLCFAGRLAALLLSHVALSAMLLRRALPAIRQSNSAPLAYS